MQKALEICSVFNENKSVPTAQNKFNKIFNFTKEDWKKIYILPFITTNNSKLQWLQYRINHNILVTNQILNKIKIIDNSKCTFCEQEEETLVHIFWDCELVQNLFKEVNTWLNNVNVSKKHMLFGNTDKMVKGNAYNIILLVIKQYIYTTRCLKKKLSLSLVKSMLKNTYELEKIAAIKKQRLDDFHLIWSDFEDLFSPT